MSLTLHTLPVLRNGGGLELFLKDAANHPSRYSEGFGDRCHMAGDCQHGPVEANEVLENGRQPCNRAWRLDPIQRVWCVSLKNCTLSLERCKHCHSLRILH
jgi:hypothetical protein